MKICGNLEQKLLVEQAKQNEVNESKDFSYIHRILTTNMYTIIVGEFLGWQTFSYFAKTIEIFFGKCVFQCKMCVFSPKNHEISMTLICQN
jgi:hypothetical protein